MDQQFVTLIVSLAGVTVLPLAGFGTNLLIQNAKLANIGVKGKKQELLQMIMSSAVMTAQQKYKAGVITAEERNADAMRTSASKCAMHKLNVPEDIRADMLEASVWDDLSSPAATGVAGPVVLSPQPGTLDSTLPPKGSG